MEKVDIIEIFKGTFNEECLRYTRTPFRWNGKNFIETLNDKLIGYQIIVSKFFSALKVCTQYQDYLTYKLKINIICDKLILCIQEYFKGLPHRAYNEFDTMIKETFDEKIKFLDCFLPWLGDTKFYRTVAIFDGRSYNRERCFHVPYNMREKVSTIRFSIQGHPSL